MKFVSETVVQCVEEEDSVSYREGVRVLQLEHYGPVTVHKVIERFTAHQMGRFSSFVKGVDRSKKSLSKFYLNTFY